MTRIDPLRREPKTTNPFTTTTPFNFTSITPQAEPGAVPDPGAFGGELGAALPDTDPYKLTLASAMPGARPTGVFGKATPRLDLDDDTASSAAEVAKLDPKVAAILADASDPKSVLGVRLAKTEVTRDDLERFMVRGEVSPALARAMEVVGVSGEYPPLGVVARAYDLRAAYLEATGSPDAAAVKKLAKSIVPDGEKRRIAYYLALGGKDPAKRKAAKEALERIELDYRTRIEKAGAKPAKTWSDNLGLTLDARGKVAVLDAASSYQSGVVDPRQIPELVPGAGAEAWFDESEQWNPSLLLDAGHNGARRGLLELRIGVTEKFLGDAIATPGSGDLLVTLATDRRDLWGRTESRLLELRGLGDDLDLAGAGELAALSKSSASLVVDLKSMELEVARAELGALMSEIDDATSGESLPVDATTAAWLDYARATSADGNAATVPPDMVDTTRASLDASAALVESSPIDPGIALSLAATKLGLSLGIASVEDERRSLALSAGVLAPVAADLGIDAPSSSDAAYDAVAAASNARGAFSLAMDDLAGFDGALAKKVKDDPKLTGALALYGIDQHGKAAMVGFAVDPDRGLDALEGGRDLFTMYLAKQRGSEAWSEGRLSLTAYTAAGLELVDRATQPLAKDAPFDAARDVVEEKLVANQLWLTLDSELFSLDADTRLGMQALLEEHTPDFSLFGGDAALTKAKEDLALLEGELGAVKEDTSTRLSAAWHAPLNGAVWLAKKVGYDKLLGKTFRTSGEVEAAMDLYFRKLSGGAADGLRKYEAGFDYLARWDGKSESSWKLAGLLRDARADADEASPEHIAWRKEVEDFVGGIL